MKQGIVKSVFRNINTEFILLECKESKEIFSSQRAIPQINSKKLKIGDKVFFKKNLSSECRNALEVIEKIAS